MDPSMLELLDDDASTFSGLPQTFDLDAWKKTFKPLHPALEGKMYFL